MKDAIAKFFGRFLTFLIKRPAKVVVTATTITKSQQIETPEGMFSVTFTNTGNVPVKVNNWTLNTGGQLIMASDIGETNVTPLEVTFYPTSSAPFLTVLIPELTVSYSSKAVEVKDF